MKYLSSEKMLVLLGAIWIVFGAGVYASSIFWPAPVTISWSTETEFDTAGFNIYRSDTLDGEYEQVNLQLLPGSAEPASGANYSWVDQNAEPGRSYFYQLEDVEYSNNRTRHAPFEHRATGITPTKIVISICGLLLGLALVVYGSFEVKRKSEKISAISPS